MIVSLDSKRSLEEKLEAKINLDEYHPHEARVAEIAENIIDCYEYDLETEGLKHFTIPNDPFQDIISYVAGCGGYEMFDFSV